MAEIQRFAALSALRPRILEKKFASFTQLLASSPRFGCHFLLLDAIPLLREQSPKSKKKVLKIHNTVFHFKKTLYISALT